MLKSPAFDPIKSDPRYKDLLALTRSRIKKSKSDAWSKTGLSVFM
jgi:hypothetical protein